MRKVSWIVIWFGLGLGSTAAVEKQQAVSARQTMYRLAAHLEKGDLTAARRLCLSGADFAALSARTVDPAEYEKKRDAFLQRWAKDFAAGLRVAKAETADVVLMPKGRKLVRETALVVFYVTFRVGDKPLPGQSMSFFFVNHGGMWKLFLRR